MADLVQPAPQGDVRIAERTPVVASTSFYSRRGKRVMDLAVGTPLFLLFLPLMVVVGLAVLITCGRPVFYVAERAGKAGKPIRVWKFRTMVPDGDKMFALCRESHPHLLDEYLKNFKLKDDPRVTPLGRYLRKASLDELPQLWAVVLGHMSLVGPRPYFHRELMAKPEIHQAVWSVLPGVTGPWQVLGRNELPPTARMQLDVEYARNVALTRDLKYLLQTVRPIKDLNGL